jgi:hypothetical protein
MRPQTLPLRPVLAALALISVSAGTGCNQKDPEKCTQAQQVVRQSLDLEDFNLAQQWRGYAYSNCDDPGALAQLDQSIVDKQNAVKTREETKAKKEAEKAQLMKMFGDFVAQNRAAPERASANPVCDPPPADAPAKAGEPSKDRFCTGVRQVGTNYTFQVRYWEADPKAFRFTVTPESPVTCDLIGPAQPSKQWDVAATGGKSVKRTRCQMGGPLQGLLAVVSAASRAEVSVFSPEYVERDPGMKPILEGP